MWDRKAYYQRTKNAQKQNVKRWRSDNPEAARAQARRGYKSRRNNNYIKVMLEAVRARAKRESLPFNLTEADIIIPLHCPALGLELKPAEGLHNDNSPSLDKIVPAKGYIKGNVRVISWRANRIKCDATAEELRRITEYAFQTNLVEVQV